MSQDKRVLYSWQDAIEPPDSQNERYHVLTAAEARIALTALYRQAKWRTRWVDDALDWHEVQSTVARAIHRLENPAEIDTDNISVVNRAGGIVEICEDEIMRFSTETLDGVTLLVEDCGCGEKRKFVLTPYAGKSGTTTNPANDSGGFIGNVVSATNENCYADKAAAEFSTRLKAFSATLIDALNNALDLTLDPTDAFDTVSLLTRIVNTPAQFADIGDLSLAAIETAIDNDVTPNIASNWKHDGEVRRIDVQALAIKVPLTSGVVPIRFIYEAWSNTVNIRQLNRALSVYAAECETGNEAPVVYETVTFEDGGTDYIAKRIATNVVSATGQEIMLGYQWDTSKSVNIIFTGGFETAYELGARAYYQFRAGGSSVQGSDPFDVGTPDENTPGASQTGTARAAFFAATGITAGFNINTGVPSSNGELSVIKTEGGSGSFVAHEIWVIETA